MTTSVEVTTVSRNTDEVPAYLDYTAPLPGFSAVIGSSSTEIRPITSVDNGGPIAFRIPKDPLRNVQPAFMRISGKFIICKEDAGRIEDDALVTAVDNFGSAWIKHVDVTIGGEPQNLSVGYNYYIKAQLCNLLNYDESARRCHLKAGGSHEELVNTGPNNEPRNLNDEITIKQWTHLETLRKRFAKSNPVTFSSDLHLDFTRTNRDWVNNMEVILEFHRNSPQFVLIKNTVAVREAAAAANGNPAVTAITQNTANTINASNYTYRFEDLVLHVRKVQPSTALLNANETRLLSKPALYPFQSWTCNQHILPRNQKNFHTSSFFSGRIPSKTIYILMKVDQETGTYDM